MSAPTDVLNAAHHLEIQSLLDCWNREIHDSAGRYEIVKIEKIVNDILQYLSECSSAVRMCVEGDFNSRFFHKIRTPVQKMTEINKSIAEFLRDAFSIIELQPRSEVVSLLQKATEQSVDTVKYITSISKQCEAATAFIELRDVIFREAKDEISECMAQSIQLSNTILSFSLSGEFTAKSLSDFLDCLVLLDKTSNETLNFFFTADEQRYRDKFKEIEARLEPIEISISLMKRKVADLHEARELLPQELKDADRQFSALVQESTLLAQKISELKSKTIGVRYVGVCDYMTSRVLEIIDELTSEASSKVDKISIGSRFKTCSAGINIIEKIVSSLPGEASLRNSILKYNLKVAPKWMRLNDILREYKMSEQTAYSLPRETLHPMRTIKLRTPRAEHNHKRDSNLGLGINLHLGVEPSPPVPYSIVKADRIIDLKLDAHSLPNSKHKLAGLQPDRGILNDLPIGEKSTLDQEQSSLPSTPRLFSLHSPMNTVETATTGTTPFYKDDSEKDTCNSKRLSIPPFVLHNKKFSLRDLPKHDLGISRIPKAVANHWQLNLPVLRKNRQLSHGPSRIPTISPDNEVFCSPDRRAIVKSRQNKNTTNFQTSELNFREKSSSIGHLRSPPAFLIVHENKAEQSQRNQNGRQFGALGDVTNSLARSKTLKIPAKKLSLSGISTPDLAFSNDTSVQVVSPVHWRSTSPERPGSSMGSRYDEANLMQPLKPVKKAWR